ncbi:MAG TPA: ATP-binding protein [Chthoniobacterales bacterium]|nr:ATP-binding protein [Chthoniobacterales bacterium]
MNAGNISLWLALSIQLGLGLAVYRANSRNHANQSFLILSFFISAWLLSLRLAFDASAPSQAELWIRNAWAGGVLMINGFNLLRLGILCRDSGWKAIGKRSVWFLIPSLIAIGVCYTPFFLRGAVIRRESGHELIPLPNYGPLFPIFDVLVGCSVIALIALYIRDLRRTAGVQKVEFQFIILGGIALALLIASTSFVDRAIAMQVAPFRIVVFSLIIAYGIATRKLMDVGFFFRRIMSYAVLTAYLLAIYGLVWWLVSTASKPVFPSESRTVAHLAAALAVAFAMAPARGISQRFADRLFIGSRGMDFQSTMSQAAGILKSVTTLQDLLDRFAKTIGEAVGTDRVFILLPEKEAYAQHYPAVSQDSEGESLQLNRNDPMISYLQTNQEVLVLDELHRIRMTPELEQAADEMAQLKTAVALGIFSRQHLAGVMLLGPRLSGRIYGAVEQNALQVLCGQLAVAIDNAQLFTEVENARIYNQTLLENLTTGVIAAGADERVTVFNNEAGQITGLSPRDIIDHSLDRLPPRLREILCETLRTGERQEDSELVVPFGDHNAVVRASSSIFHGQEGEMLGALVVLTDITALKRLELQIRRSDRLASLGTLSAGMAHEIKNPLVSIKTFAQLLPERYQDSDFRDTFSNLIGHEIDRIDSLVNQLLRFARPAKPVLRPMHVHDVLEKSLQLVGHRLYQKEIKLTRSWEADVDTIRADADQLEQVFLNFFLNAMDAMNRGGELAVTTEIHAATEWVRAISGTNGDSHEILRVSICDDGEGIRKEDIPHVFDPFFTTKDYGTGLGLSVVHGIIQEHGGQIEVESELKKGTAFHILLPLVRFAQGVAAA